jgi:hypothetical protein
MFRNITFALVAAAALGTAALAPTSASAWGVRHGPNPLHGAAYGRGYRSFIVHLCKPFNLNYHCQ